MLLASTATAPRSLHREVHMEEPNTKQQQLPLQSNACFSAPEESSGRVEDEEDCDYESKGISGPRTLSKSDTQRMSHRPQTPPSIAKSSILDCCSSEEAETETTETPKVWPQTSQWLSPSDVPSAEVSSNSNLSSSCSSREEDDRDYGKEEGKEEAKKEPQSPERQSPSPSPSSNASQRSIIINSATIATSSPSPSPASNARPIRSALKSPGEGNKKKTKGKNFRTRRRIRGLWSDDSNSCCSELHDETMLKIMAYLNMKDLCVTSMVCQRWKHLSLHQSSWKSIDATEFVVQAHTYFVKKEQLPQAKATKFTSLALAKRMERYTPHSLSIHSIEHRLSADNFLSSLPGLQELTLTSFAELTDTHIHVLLLSSSCLKNGVHAANRSRRSCVLRKLVLEDCPRLTDATVQSIGKLCPDLEELSLAGSPNIKELSALQDLWTICHKSIPRKKPAPAPLTSLFPSLDSSTSPPSSSPPSLAPQVAPTPPTPSQANSNLSSLFGGPPTSPPRPSTPPNSNALASLFAPPGQSPVRRQSVFTLSRPLSKGKDQKMPGRLARINVSNTGVTAQALLSALKLGQSNSTVRLEKLIMAGSGESWNDALLQELAQVLDVPKLQVLDISCRSFTNEIIPTATSATSIAGNSCITDDGLKPFLRRVANLKELHLMGHATLTMETLAHQGLISSTLMDLHTLNLGGCRGISTKSANPLTDMNRTNALAKLLGALSTRGSLRCLSLAHCFSNRDEIQNNPDLLAHEECLGQELINALTCGAKKKRSMNKSSPSSDAAAAACAMQKLRELDLRGCWFVTSKDTDSLRQHCPGIETIQLEGTRASL